MVTADLGACEWFIYELRRSNLIDRGQLDQIVGEYLKRHPRGDAQALAAHLVKHGALTPFQAERVLTNKSQGLVLGPYVLTDALGSGSMGTVYKAMSKTDNRAYAVKVLPRRSMWNVRMARRQVRAFGQFSHAAVVPFVDVGTSGGTHYLVWPLVEGESLESVVKREGKLTPEQTAQIGVQVANGLVACHGQSLFHGLLKPSNIMVGPDFQIAVLDFGIGSLLAENEGESLVDTMSTANTLTSGLDCASPESIMEPTNRTPAGDQYSLGCILYFCLTGQYPFPDGSAVEKMVSHQFKQPKAVKELAPSTPDEIAAVIDRLMQKKADDRFAGADEVADRLLPLAAGRPVEGALTGAAAPPPITQAPRLSSFIQPPAPNRPSSLILPPAPPPPATNGSSASHRALQPTTGSSASHRALQSSLFPTPPPYQPRRSVHSQPAPETKSAQGTQVRHYRQEVSEPEDNFKMPPGYVPEPAKVGGLGTLAVAAVGVGAMVLSYIAFLNFHPFK
jgi:serine/threonine-protein kinase